MSKSKVFLALVGLILLLGSAAVVGAQRPPYGVEEFNTYVDTTPNRVSDPKQRLEAIDTFLQKYPQSVLRAFVYPNQAQTAFGLQRHATVMKAVDSFLAMDREAVTRLYKQSNYNDTQITGTYYQMYLLYTYSFLQSFRNGTPDADALAAKAAERARKGLELHQELYSQVQPPADEAARRQFEQQKEQAEASFHNTLAFTAWRNKDYTSAAREYLALVNYQPRDPAFNYRLGQALLRKQPPNYPHAFWHLARAISLKVPKTAEVKDYLTQAVAGYQQVLPECIASDVNNLIRRATESVHPPPNWSLETAEQVNAVRQAMNVKRILDDLQAGGETAHLMWLASCGSEIGASEEGTPELPVLVLEVSESADNLVTLRAAAGQEAADAKQANLEVKVIDPPAAKNLKVEDVVRISGKISNYQNEPEFLLKLTEAKVNPEDIPESRR